MADACRCDAADARIVALTEFPVRVTGPVEQGLWSAVDVLAFDEIDFELRVFQLEDSVTSIEVQLQTGMERDTDSGWVDVGTVWRVSASNTAEKKHITGMLRYLRWTVITLSGGGANKAATFLVRGVGRSWRGNFRPPNFEHVGPGVIRVDLPSGPDDWKLGLRARRLGGNGRNSVIRPRDQQLWLPDCGEHPWGQTGVCDYGPVRPRGMVVVPDDYATIRSALQAVPNGGVVCVRAGEYFESTLDLNRNVTISGAGSAKTRVHYVTRQTGPLPLVALQPGVAARIQGLTLFGGNPSIASDDGGAESAPPILELRDVQIFGPGSRGGIKGTLHLKGEQLKINGSAGHGIDITGSADVRESVVAFCAGWGIIIANRLQTPKESWAGIWKNQFCGQSSSNGRGGLWIRGSAGDPFVITGEFEQNWHYAVVLEEAHLTVLAGLFIWITHPTAPEIGLIRRGLIEAKADTSIGVYIVGSTCVTVRDCTFIESIYGVLLKGCQGEGQHPLRTTAILTDNIFYSSVFPLAMVPRTTYEACDCGHQPLFAGTGNFCLGSPEGNCKVAVPLGGILPCPLEDPPLTCPDAES